ncbi:bifunctional DNA primase/polymerase [Phytomonospora sp. NPDC050363]|uniref:bifunctional DNA primase/polymerase n=1 Tax=Phytomonospora sp. NPDC050363 TaxID=3155642 RepID=UPI0033F12787
MSDHLAAALAAAERGWHVFPLKPGEKRPAVRDWENRATIDAARIERCWKAGPFGVGIACGPSRLIVVDLDRPKPGFEWPPAWSMVGVFDGADVLCVLAERAGQAVPLDTHTTRTASGGTHLYFQAPAGADLRNTSGDKGQGLGPLIDTRANGGYVVAAGTILADGSTYTTVYDRDPAPLPAWLVTALTPAPPPLPPPPVQLKPGTGDRKERYIAAVIARQVEVIRQAARDKTGRNNALFMSAQNLGQLVAGGVMAETRAAAELERAAVAVGLPVIASRKTIASGLRAGAKRPRTFAEVSG